MQEIVEVLDAYTSQVADIADSPGSTEPTYYPAIQRLLGSLLRLRRLPFEVRVNTSQRRNSGGTDLPDLAFYDGGGDYVVVFGEVKTPNVELAELAMSTENDDQIGRYLARTGVVLLVNVRAFGLLAVTSSYGGDGPVSPDHRQLLETVELWPSSSALFSGREPDIKAAVSLVDLVESAVTEWAPIAEPESLARILARQARRAKADLPTSFSSAVRPLLDDFGDALGLTFEGSEGEEFLRSSLIQTAFYSLFAGWTLWHHSNKKRDFDWRDLGDYLKIPFLGALFYEFRHPVRLKELGLTPHLDQATATLNRVAEEQFFGRFAVPQVIPANDSQEVIATQAILYFYEPFLEAFDPHLRKELGVWYTPPEIVRYQVRRVERILRDELDCPRGFADNRVVVLDPCCGTGAYLLEVIRCVAKQLEQEGAGKVLASKLLDAFCRRIIGFEILTAPFVIAQLQLYLMLSEMGVEPDETHRPAIFLTNALTGWNGPEQLKLQFPELQQEHDAAQKVKREGKIIVILGNPPYNRFAGVPLDEEQELADHYKGIRRDSEGRQVGSSELYSRFGIRKHLLDDLYLRFFRLAEIRIGEEAKYGVVSFISNYSYLSGRSHPLMRESLLQSFDRIWIDSLNGDKYRTGKVIPKGLPGAGTSDQSVFTTEQDPRGIQVGTAISTFLKKRPGAESREIARVYHRQFWGTSSAKRQSLLMALELEAMPDESRKRVSQLPEGPRDYQPVEPTERTRWKVVPLSFSGGYEDWPSLDDLCPFRFQGVNPARGLDGSLVDTSQANLEARMLDYYSDISFEALQEMHPVLLTPRARYEPEEVRKQLQRQSAFDPKRIVPYLLFPMDLRFIYYETEAKLLTERSPKLWDNLHDNLFLVALPQARQVSETRPLVASTLFDYHLHDHGSFGFPVHARQDESETSPHLFTSGSGEPEANIALSAWQVLKNVWSLDGDTHGDSARRLVLDLFHLVLAIGHAPQFHLDHKDAVSHDWIHVPVPRQQQVFREAARLGARVRRLLDPMADVTRILDDLLGSNRRTLGVPETRNNGVIRNSDLAVTISYFGAAKGGREVRAQRETEAAHTAWGETTGDLYLNDSTYLANVPERVWNYELGGYPVIKKWLGYRDQKRRPGRPLSHEELDHLRSIIHRIAALLLLHQQLDDAYDAATAESFTGDELGV